MRHDGGASGARPTQAERSAATQARLLEATVDCLAELGWAGTSTTEVVRRAGVSRGAQVHHFPTKDELVLAAIEHLLTQRKAEYRAAFDALPPERRTLGDAFELLWTACFGPSFDAWLELAVAARRSPSLHDRFAAAQRRFGEETTDVFQQLFPAEFGDRAIAEVAMRMAFSVLDGLALGRIAGVPDDDLRAVRDAYILVTGSFLASLPQGGS